MTVQRRKRIEGNTFGPIEMVFGGETMEERLERLEAENAALTLMILQASMNEPTPEEEAGGNA